MIVAGYLLAAMALLGVLAMTAWSDAHAGQRHPLMHDGPVIIMYTLGAWLFLLTSTRCRGLFIVSQRPPCTPGVDPEVKGNTTMFTYERALPMDGWSYDRAMRGEVARGRSCAIPTGKCQPPSMLQVANTSETGTRISPYPLRVPPKPRRRQMRLARTANHLRS